MTDTATVDFRLRLRRKVGRLAREVLPLPVTHICTQPETADSLAKALTAAAEFDIYWSNEYFYQWLVGAAGSPRRVATWLRGLTAPMRSVKAFVAEGRRFLVVERRSVPFDAKFATLRELALDLRIPGAGVAYARALAKRGDFAEALAVAQKNLDTARLLESEAAERARAAARGGTAAAKVPPLQYELHVIENQIFALERTIAGQNVHQALKRYLGDDDGYLKARTCHFPFERIDIQENGNCAVCCSQWMPRFSTGNVLTDSVSALDIFKNNRSVAARQSMLDGSFKFCDLVKCPFFANDNLPKKEEAHTRGENTKRALQGESLVHDYPSYVLLAFDQSCNLSCPSCRSHVITEKLEMQTKKEELIGSSIAPLLKQAKVLQINPAGELFVSRPLRRLLSKLNKADYPDLRLSIISNGMLLNQREWDKFPGIHDMVEAIRVSTDGATKSTFEKLRRGGRWEIFCDNLKFMAGLKDRNTISFFALSFTYQIDNFREMPAFVDMCEELTPSVSVIFEKLENWGTFDPEDYKRMAVHKSDHPLHEEFLAIISQPKMKVVPKRLYADYAGFL
jgi:hypothetical protein